jgi:hypothetical protein
LVEALCYKPEGRRFKSRIRWIFFNLLNPSSRTKALRSTQRLTKMSTRDLPLRVKCGRLIRLTTLPPSVCQMPENVGASTSHNPKGLHGLYMDKFTLPGHQHLLNYT